MVSVVGHAHCYIDGEEVTYISFMRKCESLWEYETKFNNMLFEKWHPNYIVYEMDEITYTLGRIDSIINLRKELYVDDNQKFLNIREFLLILIRKKFKYVMLPKESDLQKKEKIENHWNS